MMKPDTSDWEIYSRKVAAIGGRAKRATIGVSKDRKTITVSPKARQDAGLKPGDRFHLMMDTKQRGFKPMLGIRKSEKGDWKLPKSPGFSCSDFIAHYRIKTGSYEASVKDGVLQAEVTVLPK